MTQRPIPVAVLGATGTVGQRFIALLDRHPWFEIRALTASQRSAGRPYRDAVTWVQATPIPDRVADIELRPTAAAAVAGCRVAFSALDARVAGEIEEEIARAGLLVVSNAKSHRMDPDVPLLIPEVNPGHLDLARAQNFGDGAILTNPNCSTIGLVMALKPLDDAFGVAKVHAVTLQALSGAGLPGVPSYQLIDNILPWIGGEEEKMQREARKLLGRLDGDRIVDHGVVVSAACNRVPVIDGHMICVSVAFERPASADDVRHAWRSFIGEPASLALPSAPRPPLHYLEEPDAPQPRLHRDLGGGMATTIGRLRPCELLDYKFVTLSHNTLRGAAGGSLLVGELAVARGLVDDAGSAG